MRKKPSEEQEVEQLSEHRHSRLIRMIEHFLLSHPHACRLPRERDEKDDERGHVYSTRKVEKPLHTFLRGAASQEVDKE